MIAKLFDVKETPNRGKGLFAKQLIPKGTIVWFECDKCQTRTAEELGYDKMSEEEKFALLDTTYRKKDGTFLTPCDETRYLNHSCNANILGTEYGFDIVVRDIQEGEEATYDYRDFHDEVKIFCGCGEENCCGVVDFAHPIPEVLKRFWQEKIDNALRRTNQVHQPLLPELRKNSIPLPPGMDAR